MESRLCHEIHKLHIARIRAEMPLQYFVNEGFDRDSVVDGNVPAGSSPKEVLVQGKRRGLRERDVPCLAEFLVPAGLSAASDRAVHNVVRNEKPRLQPLYSPA